MPPTIFWLFKFQILFGTSLIILLRGEKILNRSLILFLPVFWQKTVTLIKITSTCRSLYCKRNYNSITIEFSFTRKMWSQDVHGAPNILVARHWFDLTFTWMFRVKRYQGDRLTVLRSAPYSTPISGAHAM